MIREMMKSRGINLKKVETRKKGKAIMVSTMGNFHIKFVSTTKRDMFTSDLRQRRKSFRKRQAMKRHVV